LFQRRVFAAAVCIVKNKNCQEVVNIRIVQRKKDERCQCIALLPTSVALPQSQCERSDVTATTLQTGDGGKRKGFYGGGGWFAAGIDVTDPSRSMGKRKRAKKASVSSQCVPLCTSTTAQHNAKKKTDVAENDKGFRQQMYK
jgi:hypothetical protein